MTLTPPRPRARSDPPRYGDYPELFWDMNPDAPIAADDPIIISRLLREGSLDAIFALVPLSRLERAMPDLVIPEHTRLFWTGVLELRRAKEERKTGA